MVQSMMERPYLTLTLTLIPGAVHDGEAIPGRLKLMEEIHIPSPNPNPKTQAYGGNTHA